jgi:excisionase family DNA binding protein
MNDKLLRGEEVADQLGISKAFAYRLMANGAIQVVRIGRSVRVRPENLEEFINSHLQKQGTSYLGKGDYEKR